VAINTQAPNLNQGWAAEKGWTYEVWTDDRGTLHSHYGVSGDPRDPNLTGKMFLLDPQGNVQLMYEGSAADKVASDCAALYP
jgi:hypothetical protein